MNQENITELIVENLSTLLVEKELKLSEESSPTSAKYLREWRIQDRNKWNYAGFAENKNGGYEYTLASAKSLPFEAQETIEWVKEQIVEVCGKWTKIR